MNKIFRLTVTFHPGYDEIWSMAVIATDEDEARLIADAKDHDSGLWLDGESVTCEECPLEKGVIMIETTGG